MSMSRVSIIMACLLCISAYGNDAKFTFPGNQHFPFSQSAKTNTFALGRMPMSPFIGETDQSSLI
jgi:hypothetical protein